MKVIFAGFSKTGTKSMNAALTALGYKVYDFLENFWYHYDAWEDIFANGGNIETFKRMYQDIDAVVDIPAFTFWEEIHDAFPDSKIILITRDEDSWFRSIRYQVDELNQWNMFKLSRIFTPTGRKFMKHYIKCLTACYGTVIPPAWCDVQPNEILAKKSFRQHNFYVSQKAPKDKLLIYKMRDGWEPLCKFLGVEVPDIPFPHKNVRGSAIKEAAEENPLMKKIIQEVKILFVFVCFAVIIISGLLAYVFSL